MKLVKGFLVIICLLGFYTVHSMDSLSNNLRLLKENLGQLHDQLTAHEPAKEPHMEKALGGPIQYVILNALSNDQVTPKILGRLETDKEFIKLDAGRVKSEARNEAVKNADILFITASERLALAFEGYLKSMKKDASIILLIKDNQSGQVDGALEVVAEFNAKNDASIVLAPIFYMKDVSGSIPVHELDSFWKIDNNGYVELVKHHLSK